MGINKQARLKVLELIYKAQSSHIGSNFSVIEILDVIFAKATINDKIILSAGWKACAFYYFLNKYGKITNQELDSYCQPNSKLIGLTEPGINGVEFAGGSMGFGLPASVGFALAKKIKNEPGTVYCVMSDGELDCGTYWESIEIAKHHNLNNLIVIIDNNKFQAMGLKKDILQHEIDYGISVNGHDLEALDFELSTVYEKSPRIIFANTIKGKGVDFMENNNTYHYLNISENDYRQAKDILSRID